MLYEVITIFTGVSIAVITIHLARARDPGQAFGLSIFVQWAIPGVTRNNFV